MARTKQIMNFTLNFGPQHPTAHVRHKVVDTESTYPMSLAMSCLFLGTSGMWRQLLHHYHRTKGSLLGNSSEANCLGERTKVVKLGSLSTLEVLIEMNKGISILYCG
ncbi:hypothetical protein BDL97_09G046400 [Sphagnum fallax]|nr:hypothetical protein BDL97_09G046400 [Sphagnum fallax]